MRPSSFDKFTLVSTDGDSCPVSFNFNYFLFKAFDHLIDQQELTCWQKIILTWPFEQSPHNGHFRENPPVLPEDFPPHHPSAFLLQSHTFTLQQRLSWSWSWSYPVWWASVSIQRMKCNQIRLCQSVAILRWNPQPNLRSCSWRLIAEWGERHRMQSSLLPLIGNSIFWLLLLSDFVPKREARHPIARRRSFHPRDCQTGKMLPGILRNNKIIIRIMMNTL